MRFKSLAAVATVALFAASPLHAQGTAVALRAGSLGPSLGVVTSLGSRINVRIDVPYLPYSRSDLVTVGDYDLDVDSDIELLSFVGALDIHPFANTLRITAGAVVNKSEGTFTLRSAEPLTISGSTYSVEEIGRLDGIVKMGADVAPYVGIGFGNPVGPGKRLGFSFDVGAMFSGAPDFTMTGRGMMAPTASQADQIEENLGWIEFYPNLSFGLTYKIF